MKEKKKSYPNPKFDNVVDEDAYWKTHSPLAEGYPAEIQKEKQKRSSFLTIRLTGEELTQLRDLASSKGMGPSTYMRTLIKDQLTPLESAELILHKDAQLLQSILQDIAYDKKAGGTTAVKDKSTKQYEAFRNSFCILDQSKSSFSAEQLNDLTSALIHIIYQFISNACVRVIAPGDSEFEVVKRIAKQQSRSADI